MINSRKIRTRYAPSPTGFQHIGGIRTAIINYLLAKSLDGEFLLRIEDTDGKRFVKGAEEYILKTLNWLSIGHDEGPDIGGKFAPYRQSERKAIYSKYAFQLLEKNQAYYAFDTEGELRIKRDEEIDKGSAFLYNYLTRDNLKNSISLNKLEVKKLLALNTPFVIRLKLPPNETIKFYDEIRGEISVNTSQLEDKILLKSDGSATYHLASVVDDTLMEITHVIRGEEWLPSAPIHHYLYKVFDWEDSKPSFAHLPLILNPDGKGKLSKRKLRDASIPIFPLDWTNQEGNVVNGLKEAGFLPEAVINILILLGWHDSNDNEIYTVADLLKSFDFSKIQKSGAKFDYQKAKWINARHIQMSDTDNLRRLFIELFPKYESNIFQKKLSLTIDLTKERLFTMLEINNYDYLFDTNFDLSRLKSCILEEETTSFIYSTFSEVKDWTNSELKDSITKIQTSNIIKMKPFYHFLRERLTGQENGPDIIRIMEIIGKDECLNRLSGGITG